MLQAKLSLVFHQNIDKVHIWYYQKVGRLSFSSNKKYERYHEQMYGLSV